VILPENTALDDTLDTAAPIIVVCALQVADASALLRAPVLAVIYPTGTNVLLAAIELSDKCIRCPADTTEDEADVDD